MNTKFILSALTRATLQSKLKAINQRIVQLTKTFGSDSPIVQDQVDVLKKGAAQQFLDTSASGNVKISMRKVTSALKGENGLNEVNEVLSKIAGIKINPDGSVTDLPKQGVKTVQEVRKQIRKRLEKLGEDPSEYTQAEQTSIYEEILRFEQSFETAYQATIANEDIGEKKMRSDPVTQKLWGENRPGFRRLTYRELEQIKNRMDQMLAEAKAKALSFEEKNKKDL